MSQKRLISGMRPTGKLHLGHLVGALSNWSSLQETHDCFFMVADWHAFMSEYENSRALRENILDNVADWLAAGISPEKSTIFIQSQVPEHLELAMIFSAITPLGWLERCPTYKEQMRELADRHVSTYAFLGYPVLQAADIALYKGEAVPVGEDQLPHLELTREIVRKFNATYKPVFPEPKPHLAGVGRLLGLDGRKMSKSYNNSIALADSPDEIVKKVQTMFTDPKRVRRTDPGHPETCNVCSYYEIFAPSRKEAVVSSCRSAAVGCTECKRALAEALVAFLKPHQERRRKYLDDPALLEGLLNQGRQRAKAAAEATMRQAREAICFIPCPTK